VGGKSLDIVRKRKSAVSLVCILFYRGKLVCRKSPSALKVFIADKLSIHFTTGCLVVNTRVRSYHVFINSYCPFIMVHI